MYSSFIRSIQASPSRGPALVFSMGSFCTVALVASSGPDDSDMVRGWERPAFHNEVCDLTKKGVDTVVCVDPRELKLL